MYILGWVEILKTYLVKIYTSRYVVYANYLSGIVFKSQIGYNSPSQNRSWYFWVFTNPNPKTLKFQLRFCEGKFSKNHSRGCIQINKFTFLTCLLVNLFSLTNLLERSLGRPLSYLSGKIRRVICLVTCIDIYAHRHVTELCRKRRLW